MAKKSLQTKRIFNRSEVEDYVKKMLTSAEVTMSEQKDRIVELKQEVDRLNRANEEQQNKIKLMQRGLNETERANKQIVKDMNIQTKLVVEKVQQFGFKWKAYFGELFENIEELKSNVSVELFSSDISELVSEVIEASMPRASVDEAGVPMESGMILSEDEWIDRRLKKLSEEPSYTLSSDNEGRYKEVMNRLKSSMIYASQIESVGETEKFNIQDALNPKDSLEQIIKDIK